MSFMWTEENVLLQYAHYISLTQSPIQHAVSKKNGVAMWIMLYWTCVSQNKNNIVTAVLKAQWRERETDQILYITACHDTQNGPLVFGVYETVFDNWKAIENVEEIHVKEVVWYFGKYSQLLSCREWDEKIHTTLMSVAYAKYKATDWSC